MVAEYSDWELPQYRRYLNASDCSSEPVNLLMQPGLTGWLDFLYRYAQLTRSKPRILEPLTAAVD